jgi:hypothetical protein
LDYHYGDENYNNILVLVGEWWFDASFPDQTFFRHCGVFDVVTKDMATCYDGADYMH